MFASISRSFLCQSQHWSRSSFCIPLSLVLLHNLSSPYLSLYTPTILATIYIQKQYQVYSFRNRLKWIFGNSTTFIYEFEFSNIESIARATTYRQACLKRNEFSFKELFSSSLFCLPCTQYDRKPVSLRWKSFSGWLGKEVVSKLK